MLSRYERNKIQAAGHVAEYFVLVNKVGSNSIEHVSDVFSSIDRAESEYWDIGYSDSLELSSDYEYSVTLYMRLGNVVEEIDYVTIAGTF